MSLSERFAQQWRSREHRQMDRIDRLVAGAMAPAIERERLRRIKQRYYAIRSRLRYLLWRAGLN